MSIAALNSYLLPLKQFLEKDGVSEISINEPKELWIEYKGDMIKKFLPAFDLNHLKDLARLVAQATDQRISEEEPLLSATLPDGYRIQIVFPPACENTKVIMSIRKKSAFSWTLDDYEKMQAFDTIKITEEVNQKDVILGELLKAGKIKDFLQKAVLYKKNIIVSGGTSTGKTTFSNAMLRAIPPDERLITIEDAREIDLNNHPYKVNLLSL